MSFISRRAEKALNNHPQFSKLAEIGIDTEGKMWTARILLKGTSEPFCLFMNYAWPATLSVTGANKDWVNGILDAFRCRNPPFVIEGRRCLIKYSVSLAGKNNQRSSTMNKITEHFDINLQPGELKVKVLLKGESIPINLSLKYAVEGETLNLSNITVDKTWLNGLVDILPKHFLKIKLKDKMIADFARRLS